MHKKISYNYIGPRNMEVKSFLKKPIKPATIVAKLHSVAIP
jgi:hypothetical protein